MKNTKNIFLFLSASALALCSCSHDKGDNAKFLKKRVEISEDGTSATTLFTYKGNKIVSADGVAKHTDYTYANDLITKIVTKDKTTQLSVSSEFVYVKDQLVSIKYSDDCIVNYVHNADGTVSYEKWAVVSGKQEVKLYHGVLYFKNKNLIKDKRTLDDTAPGVVSNYDVSFEYDSKKNPLCNILGYAKLLDQNEAISINNKLMSVVETSTTNADDQIISSANLYKSTFK